MNGASDTRTVEMRFDNKNFESNVKQSMSTLDKLKKKLKLDGASKGLEEVEKKSRKLEFKDLNRSIDNVGKKFSALEAVATGAFMRIGMKAADAGIKIVKSFSVDQISSGWNRLANKTTAIQVIMSSLKDDASKFTDELSKMEYVEKWMEKISWFSDETSFDLPALTNGIGKLTSKAVGLEDAVTAVEGMSLWAASAGQNAQTAARMYDQLSQAVGRGYMATQDWMSVESAQMDTAEFKELAISIAKDKKLIKEGQVTVANFRESLSKKWFTTDVQIEAYKRYGEAVDYVIEKQQELADAGIEKTASEILKMLEESGEDIADTLAFKALKRGQEAKTFQEAIEATNTAVATGWMNIFETITGNYLQQRELWTDLSNDLYHIFVDPLNEMTDVLSIWSEGFKVDKVDPLADAYRAGELDDIRNDYKVISKAAAEAALLTTEADGAVYREIRTLENGSQQLVTFIKDASGQYRYYINDIFDEDKHFLSGRKVLLEGLKNLMDTFFIGWEEDIDGVKVQHLSVLDAVKQAFMEIFFPDLASAEDGGKQTIAERLFELTKKFREFTERIKPLGDKLKNVFKGFFTAINIVRKLLVAIIKPFKTLFSSIFGEVPDGVLGFTNSISDWIQQFDKFLEKNKIFEKVSSGVKAGIDAISGALDWLSQKIVGVPLKELLPTIKEKLENFFKDFSLDKIKNFFKNTNSKDASPLQKFVNFVKKIIGGLYAFLQAIYKPLKKIVGSVINWISGLSLKFTKKTADTEKKNTIFSGIESGLTNIANFLEAIYQRLKEAGTKIWDFLSTILGKIADFIKTHDLLEIVGAVLQIAIGMAIIWNIFRAIQMSKSIAYIGEGIGDVLYGVYKNLSAQVIKKIAISLLIVAGAFALLGSVKFKTSIWIIIGIFAAFLAFCTAVLAITKEFSKDKVRLAQFKLMTMAITKFVLALASSLLILSAAFAIMGAIKKFSNGSLASITKIFAAFIIAASGLAFVSAKFINNGNAYGALIGMAGFIKAMAASLVILSAAFVVMSKAKFDEGELGAISNIFGLFTIVASGLAFVSAKFINNGNAYGALISMANFIKAIAASLIILSAAFAVMSIVKFDEGELGAISNIFGLFTIIASGLAFVSAKFINNENAYGALIGMASFIKAIAASLVILSAAFAVMSMVKFDEGELGAISGIFVGFITIASLLSFLAAKFANNENAYVALKGMSAFILAMAASLIVVSAAFAIFAHTDFKHESMKSIAMVFLSFIALSTAMIAVLVALTRGLNQGYNYNITAVITGMALFINALAISLIILSAAFAIMASIHFNNNLWHIAIIFGAFITIASGIAILAVKVFKNENFVPASWKIGLMAVFVNALAASLLIVASAFSIMNSLDLESKKMWHIAGVFGAFIGFSALIALLASKMITDWDSIAGIAAVAGFIIIAAGALNLAALAISQIANGVDPEKLENVSKILIILGIIAAVLGVVGVVAGAIGPWGAVGLALIAVVIIAFGAACLLASKGISALFEALAKNGNRAAKNLEVLASSFGKAIDEVSKRFGKILLIELAILLLGVAIGVLAGALLGLSVPIAIIVGSIALLVASITNLLKVFTGFMYIVTREGAEFSNNVLTVVNSILETIIETGPKLRDAIYTLLTVLVDAVSSAIVDNINKIALSVFAIIASIAKAISDNAFLIAYSISKIIVLTILGIIASLAELAEPAMQTMIAFIGSLADAIENNLDPMIEAGKKLGEALWNGFKKSISDDPVAAAIVGLLVPGGVFAVADAAAEKFNSAQAIRSKFVPETTTSSISHPTKTGLSTDDARSEKASSKKNQNADTVVNETTTWMEKMQSIWGDYSGEGSWLSLFTSEGSKDGAINFNGLMDSAKSGFSEFVSGVKDFFGGAGNLFSGLGLGGGKEKSELDLAYERGELDSLDNKYKTITKSAAEAAVESKRTGDILYREILTLEDGSQKLATHIRQADGMIHVEYLDIYNDEVNGLQNMLDGLLGSEYSSPTITPIIDGSKAEEWLSDFLGNNVLQVTGQEASSAAYSVNAATNQPVVNQETYTSNDIYNNTFNITTSDPKTAANEAVKLLTNQVNRKRAIYGTVE